jgi:hypothetical protein
VAYQVYVLVFGTLVAYLWVMVEAILVLGAVVVIAKPMLGLVS